MREHFSAYAIYAGVHEVLCMFVGFFVEPMDLFVVAQKHRAVVLFVSRTRKHKRHERIVLPMKVMQGVEIDTLRQPRISVHYEKVIARDQSLRVFYASSRAERLLFFREENSFSGVVGFYLILQMPHAQNNAPATDPLEMLNKAVEERLPADFRHNFRPLGN